VKFVVILIAALNLLAARHFVSCYISHSYIDKTCYCPCYNNLRMVKTSKAMLALRLSQKRQIIGVMRRRNVFPFIFRGVARHRYFARNALKCMILRSNARKKVKCYAKKKTYTPPIEHIAYM